jgi:predicted SPOUT superfamily RNA methylase MTH1
METPQYLRKRLFKLRPELQYVGILPPLRTPHHPLNRKMKNLKVGEYREGATLARTREGTLIDIGVEQPALMLNKQLPIEKRFTVKVTKVENPVEVELANRDEISTYWGYVITVEKHTFGEFVNTRGFDLAIATSKRGIPFTNVAGEIAEKWKKANTILVAFGAPSQGLYEIVKNDGFNLDDVVDFVVNMVPMQGTETIRTEEALIASLAILNMQFRF